jgi:hypothetical protein
VDQHTTHAALPKERGPMHSSAAAWFFVRLRSLPCLLGHRRSLNTGSALCLIGVEGAECMVLKCSVRALLMAGSMRKWIERELLHCESELQCLVDRRVGGASSKWLGMDLIELCKLNLESKDLIGFWTNKDSLFDNLKKHFPRVAGMCDHGKSIQFNQETKTLHYPGGIINTSWELIMGGSRMYASEIKRGEEVDRRYLILINDLYWLLCVVFGKGGGVYPEQAILVVCGKVIEEYFNAGQ